MIVMAVAAGEESVAKISKQISVTEGIELFKFTDPLLAVKYIVNYPVDMIFIDSEVKRPLDIGKFIELVRKVRPGTEITVISDRVNGKTEKADGINNLKSYFEIEEVVRHAAKIHCPDTGG